MIFPGMDPYLEDATLWTGVHARLVVYISDFLQPLLRPRYVAAVEERVYIEGPENVRVPDVWIKRRRKPANGDMTAVLEDDECITVQVAADEIHESYVAILDKHSKQRLVALIEVVSPTNKHDGPGRESYLAKQREIQNSSAHLVELDLLRAGRHVVAVPASTANEHGPYHYLACVNRAQRRRTEYQLDLRTLRQRLPRITIPLAGDDPDVVLDVQAVLEQTYAAGCYDDRIDYTQPCRPPLDPKDQAWANQLIKKAFGKNGRNGKRKTKS